MEWLRWYHGACSDSKWPIIARKSGQNIGAVVSIWAALLEHASQNEERGDISGFDPEEINALFGYEDGTAEAVIAAMAEKGVISGSRIASWGKRQPVRERDDGGTSTDRVRKFRQKQKEEKQSASCVSETEAGFSGGDETPAKRHETDCNAFETPPDKIREDKINTPSLYNASLRLSVKESVPPGEPPQAARPDPEQADKAEVLCPQVEQAHSVHQNGSGLICTRSFESKLGSETSALIKQTFSEHGAKRSKPLRKRFQKPAVSEVEDYCRERGNGIDARSFMDFYEAKGWLIGKTPMKDWRAAVRTWERREASSRASPLGGDKSSWQKDCPHFGGDAAGMTAKIPAAW